MNKNHPPQQLEDDHERTAPVGCPMPNPFSRVLTAALALLALVVVGVTSASAQKIEADPVRVTVQAIDSGTGTVTNINLDLDGIATNATVDQVLTLTVEITNTTGIVSATLDQYSFTNVAGSTNVLNANATLTVVYDDTLPQIGVNEIAIYASGAYTTRLGLPFKSAIFWNGNTNNTAYETDAYWQGGAKPAAGEVALFGTVDGTNAAPVDSGTNVIISIDTPALGGLRFAHTNGTYDVEIKTNVTVLVTGTEGFQILTDELYDEQNVDLFGGGNLMVSNSAANVLMACNSEDLNMRGLASFVADVNRVCLQDYSCYPNYTTNGAGGPGTITSDVFFARTNYIKTAWVGGEAVITNSGEAGFARPYAFSFNVNEDSGPSSSSRSRLELGLTNVFYVESILFGGGGIKATSGEMKFSDEEDVIGSNGIPALYLRGQLETNRVAVMAMGDASGPNWINNNTKGSLDLRDGKVDAMIDILYIGRDRFIAGDNDGSDFNFYVGGSNAAGTIVDVNTLYVGAQEQGTNQVNPSDLNSGNQNGEGPVQGDLYVEENAVVKVNDTLHLGYTTDIVGGLRAGSEGYGRLFVSGGTVMANTIFVGGETQVSVDNRVEISDGGELIVTNDVAQSTNFLAGFTMSDSSTLTLHVDGNNTNAYVFTDELITGGLGNILQIASVDNVGSYPAKLTLIKYDQPASPAFNLVLPSGIYGYLINNTGLKTIEVEITDQAPHDLVWDGGSGTVWDAGGADNWMGGQYFTNGDSATFNDDANGSAVTLNTTVYAGGSGVVVSNDTLAFTFTGGGTIGGAAPMSKWGSNSMMMNAASDLPLSIYEGSVIGSGSLGSTTIATNASLTFTGALARVVSSGTTFLADGSSVANGADVLAGTLTNLGNIIGSSFNVAGDAVMAVPTDGTVSMTLAPGTCTVEDGGLLRLDGTLLSAELSGPDGDYRLDIFGQLIGTGQIIAASPFLLYTEPTLNSRLNIGSGGVFSPGAAADDIVTFTNTGRFDFVTGSRIIMDVDMDSADGSNPWSGQSGGGNIWTTAKNSDVLYLSLWHTTSGVLELNNVGTTPFTNGVVLKVFKKKYDQYYIAPPSTSAKYGNISEQTKLPVMDPGRPDLGLQWDMSNFRTNGVIRVVVDPLPTNAVPLVTTWSSTNVTLSWPTNHTGWELETQENALSVGLSTNWSVVGGSTDTNQMSFPIDEDDDTRFYRLAYPSYGVTTNAP